MTYYTRGELDRLARLAVRDFKRRPEVRPIRRTIEPDGWAIIAHRGGPTLAAYFRDENGRHQINVAI